MRRSLLMLEDDAERVRGFVKPQPALGLGEIWGLTQGSSVGRRNPGL